MGQAKLRGLLAFSAILALGSQPGWTRLALPGSPLQPGASEPVAAKSEEAATGPGAAKPSEAGRKSESRETDKGKEPVKPAQGPASPDSDEDAPAREEKTDCDDCVIVRAGDEDAAAGKAAGGEPGAKHLAGTLWGLFIVARPKRIPRTIIRGVTVP